jgi:hypothetical protein
VSPSKRGSAITEVYWCANSFGRGCMCRRARGDRGGGRRVHEVMSPIARPCDRRALARLFLTLNPQFASSGVPLCILLHNMPRKAALSDERTDIPSLLGPDVSHRSGTWTWVPLVSTTIYSTFHHVLASRCELYTFRCRSTHRHLLDNLSLYAPVTRGVT